MFDNLTDEERLKRLKKVVETDYTNRHDSAMLNLFPNDLEWLVEKAELAKELEHRLGIYQSAIDSIGVLGHIDINGRFDIAYDQCLQIASDAVKKDEKFENDEVSESESHSLIYVDLSKEDLETISSLQIGERMSTTMIFDSVEIILSNEQLEIIKEHADVHFQDREKLMARVVEGDVIIRENDFPDWYFTYGDVETDDDFLTGILESEFEGKKVRVTIEVIE